MSIRSRRPSLRLLHIFQALVDERSFAAAAHQINVSQPAVSQSVQRLEALLGVSLLDRGQKRCTPSEPGSILHLRSRRLFEQIEGALGEPMIGAPFAEGRRVPTLARRITEGHVRALAAIEETGSIEQAARLLDISPPSVQRAARELEGLLRRPLYLRTARGVAATRIGAELARRLQLAIRELDYALDEIATVRGQQSASLSVGVLPLACASLLAATLNDLTDQFPGVRIQVTEAVYEPLLQQLRSGRLDLLFGVLRESQSVGDVKELPLFHDPHVVVARPSHPLMSAKRVTIDDLARYEWVAPPISAPRRRSIENLFAGSGQTLAIAIETNSLPTLKALLAASDRISLLTRQEAEVEVRNGLLDIVKFGTPIKRSPDGLTMRKDWRPTPVQRRFIELALEHAGSLTPAGA